MDDHQVNQRVSSQVESSRVKRSIESSNRSQRSHPVEVIESHRITIGMRGSKSLILTDQQAAPQAGPDQAVGLAAQDGTTRVRRSSGSHHRQHRDLHRQEEQLEHWGLEQVAHFDSDSGVVHMIAGYSADSDHCTGHHDSLRRQRGGSSLPRESY